MKKVIAICAIIMAVPMAVGYWVGYSNGKKENEQELTNLRQAHEMFLDHKDKCDTMHVNCFKIGKKQNESEEVQRNIRFNRGTSITN